MYVQMAFLKTSLTKYKDTCNYIINIENVNMSRQGYICNTLVVYFPYIC